MTKEDPQVVNQTSFSFVSLKAKFEKSLSGQLPTTKATHLKEYDAIVQQLTLFVKQKKISVPESDFTDAETLGKWIMAHNLFVEFMKGSNDKKDEYLQIALNDVNVQSHILPVLFRYLFVLVDTNHNKRVSPDELLTLLAVNLTGNELAQIELVFHYLDKDNSGVLSPEEFKTYFVHYFKMFCFRVIMTCLMTMSHAEDKNADKQSQLFRSFLTLTDNRLKDQYAEYAEPVLNNFEFETESKMKEIEKLALECFEKVDVDHDGQITVIELQKKFGSGFFIFGSARTKYEGKVRRSILRALFHLGRDLSIAKDRVADHMGICHPRSDGNSVAEKHANHITFD